MKAAYIGRFQPFHDGHKAVIQEMIEQDYTPLIVIGTGGDSDRNPYSFDEVREMIGYPAIAFEDHPLDSVWTHDLTIVLQEFGVDTIFYSDKPEDRTDGVHYVPQLLSHFTLKEVPLELPISGTQAREVLKHLPEETLRVVSRNPYLNLKQNNGYYYAERLGVDSVAFVLKNGDRYGLISEFKPPIDQHLVTAFGGSLDTEMSLEEIVKAEVLEEAGFEVELEDIHFVSSEFVSTQMNQWCHLYVVDVKDALYWGRTTTDPREQDAFTVWRTKEDILKGSCWKAKVIVGEIIAEAGL